MFNYSPELFKQAIDKIAKAYESLNSKQNVINSILNISENYENKSSVEDAALNLKVIVPQIEELLGDMAKTLVLMTSTDPSFRNISFNSSTMPIAIDIPRGQEIIKYWTGNGMAQNYLALCSIIGATSQGQDKCLATAREYAQIVCKYLGIESENEKVRNGEVGYVFDTPKDALNYIKSEIEAGYPVTLEVSNANNKHFVMAYAIKLDENNQVPKEIDETNILYLDPVAGEVKALGTSWDEYELMARHLMNDSTANNPLNVNGYWVGTFSGNEPQQYREITANGYQDSPSNNDIKHNPYAPFDYYVSITLNDGTIISNRDFTNEEKTSKSYTLPQNQLPNNLPWVNPSATSNDWYGYLNNRNYREI